MVEQKYCKIENVPTMGHIKSRVRYGDCVLLSQLLDISQSAAKKRLLRGNKEAIKALQAIIESREQLIKSYKSKNQ